MQFTNFQKVVEALNGLSTHYQDNSLEWAQKKEQYAAEWDEMLECEHDYVETKVSTQDGLDAGVVHVCSKCDETLDSPIEDFNDLELC